MNSIGRAGTLKPVANVGALPASGVVGQLFLVEDDGTGKAAIFIWDSGSASWGLCVGGGSGMSALQDIIDKDLTAPPVSPPTDGSYIVAAVATGLWTGHEDDIATWDGVGWDYTTPVEGQAVYVEDEDFIYIFDGASWIRISTRIDHGLLIGLGDDDHTQYLNTTRGDARYYTETESDANAVAAGAKVDKFIGTDHAIVRSDGITGDMQDSSATIDDSGNIAGNNLSGTNTGDEIQATESVLGIAEIATTAEVTAGTDDDRIVTAAKLAGNNYSKTESDANAAAAGAKVDKIVGTDHAVVRSDGIVGDIQDTGVIIDDSDNIDTPGEIKLSNASSDTNSKEVLLESNASGTRQTGSLQVLYGADPYLRISAPNDSGTKTGVMDIHDTLLALTNDDTVDLGASGSARLKDIWIAGDFNSIGAITGSNLSGTNTGDEVAAAEGTAGIAELATQAETDTGTDDARIVTPKKLRDSVAGTLAEYAESLSEDTHTGNTTYQDKVTKTWTSAAGTYLITGFAIMSVDAEDKMTGLRIDVDGSTQHAESMETLGKKKQSDGHYQSRTASAIVVLTAASHTIKLQYNTDSAGNTVYIKDSNLIINRIL